MNTFNGYRKKKINTFSEFYIDYATILLLIYLFNKKINITFKILSS